MLSTQPFFHSSTFFYLVALHILVSQHYSFMHATLSLSLPCGACPWIPHPSFAMPINPGRFLNGVRLFSAHSGQFRSTKFVPFSCISVDPALKSDRRPNCVRSSVHARGYLVHEGFHTLLGSCIAHTFLNLFFHSYLLLNLL